MAEEDKKTIGGDKAQGDQAPAEPKKRGPKAGVSREEFAQFQGQITEALGGVLDQLKVLAEKPQVVADSTGVRIEQPKAVNEGAPQRETPAPPAWRKLVDEILGKEFEIDLELPENGGQKFSVYIPQALSNAGKDHWSMFRRDKRTRELGNTGIKGVKEFLLRVRSNLIGSGIKLPYYEDTEPRTGIMIR